MKEFLQQVGGKLLDEDSVKNTKELLSVVVQRKPSKADLEGAKKQASSSSGSGNRTVVVDGRITEMPEWVIVGMVRLGAFTVVWPGTKNPIWFGEGSGRQPPIYIEPHLPKKPDLPR